MEIVKIAKDLDADLLVMGSRRTSAQLDELPRRLSNPNSE